MTLALCPLLPKQALNIPNMILPTYQHKKSNESFGHRAKIATQRKGGQRQQFHRL